MFSLLLAVVTGLAVAYVFPGDTSEDARIKFLVWVLLTGCTVNVWIHDVFVQQCLHDLYVFLLLYGLVVSRCPDFIFFSQAVTTLQLISRSVMGSCVFCWWKTSRNPHADLVTIVLLLASMVRDRRRLFPVVVCGVVALMSHVLDD